jgi:hypothetical protein
MVERQMLPRQTKRTETFLGGEESVIVVVLWWVVSWEMVLMRSRKARGALCVG